MGDDRGDEEKTKAAIEQRKANALDIDHIRERFMSKVDATNGCWLWKASLGPGGYGRFFLYGETYQAHRAAFIVFKGPLLPEQFVLHQCDTKLCVNPRHLRAGTHAENMREAVERGRMKAHNRILTDADVIAIRARFQGRDGEHVALGEEYGVNHSTIANIVNGNTYQHLYTAQPTGVSVQLNLFDRATRPGKTLSKLRPQGDTHHKAKMTTEKVAAMRAEHRAGARCVDLAEKYGIGKSQASAILRGKFWT